VQVNTNKLYTVPLKELTTYCQNIFSNDKVTRKNARVLVIKYIEYFKGISTLTADEENKFLPFKIVSYAVKKFVDNSEFIFKIKKNKAGPVLSLENKIVKIRNSGIHTNLPTNSDQPTYLISMLHHAADRNLDNQIRLQFEESFGTTKEESEEEAKTRLHVFVGVNYCHSLNPAENRVKKKYIEDLMDKPSKPNVSYEAFCWTPEWGSRRPNAKKAIEQTKVKRLFRLLLDLDPAKALIVYKEVMINKGIPFRGNREQTKNSKSANEFVKQFRFERKDRPLWFLTADDDAVRLRNNGFGLLTHYDNLIQLHPQMEVATTGYYMADPAYNSVETLSRILLIARQGGFLRQNAVYFCEPNMAAKTPVGDNLSAMFSFLRYKEVKGVKGVKGVKKLDTFGNLEAIGFFENLGVMKGDMTGRVIHGRIGAIQTAVSLNVKDCSKRNYEPKDYLKLDTLLKLRSFSQSCIDPRDGFSANIARTFSLPIQLASNTEMAEIYKAFDPVEYAHGLPSCWFQTYHLVREEIGKFHNLNMICNDVKIFKQQIEKNSADILKSAEDIVNKLNLDKKNTPLISKFIKEKAIATFEAVYALINTYKYSYDDVKIITYTSYNINENVYRSLKSVINQDYMTFYEG